MNPVRSTGPVTRYTSRAWRSRAATSIWTKRSSGGLGDLQPHRVSPHPLAQVLLDGLEQVFRVVLIEGQVGVAGDPEDGMAQHAEPTEESPQVGRDDVLQQHEAEPVRGRAGQHHHAVEHGRDLDHGEELLQLAGLLALDQERDVQALVVHVREWVPGVDRQRGQDRIDLVLKNRSTKARSVGLSSSSRDPLDSALPELGHQLLVQQLILVRHQPVGPLLDPVKLLHRRQAVGGEVLGLEPGVELLLQPGDPDFEELVEVGADDGEELDALEERIGRGRQPPPAPGR